MQWKPLKNTYPNLGGKIMYRILVLLMLTGHFLGDFYFQSNSLAVEKEKNIPKLFLHCLIYFIVMILVITPIFGSSAFIYALTASIAHLIVDVVKFAYKLNCKNKFSERKEAIIYLIDQAVHILCIIFIVLFISAKQYTIFYTGLIQSIYENNILSFDRIFSWILGLLIIVNPCKITIKKVLKGFKYESNYSKESNKNSDVHERGGKPNAGALIGILERSIVLLLLSVGQYSAIGFVLTAKSIARYKKISDDIVFAEYYLIGTLLSNFLVILTYLLIFI